MKISYRTKIGTLIHNGTYGSILYIDANKKIAEDNSNLYYDPSTKRVGIGTSTPEKSLHVAGTTSANYIQTDTGMNFDTVAPPDTPATVALIETSGNVDIGAHRYFVSFVTALGETEATAFTDSVVVDATHRQVQISDIPTSSDYRVTARKIYRTIVTSPLYHFKLLTTINDNITTSYVDNISDANLTGGAQYPGYFYLPNTTNDIIFVGGLRAVLANTLNTALGINAAGSLSIPSYGNIAIGFDCGKNITTGNTNTLAGINAGKGIVTGRSNTLIGGDAGFQIVNDQNVCVGAFSGYSVTSGAANTLLGSGTSFFANGSGNVFVGYNAGATASGSNQLYISNTDTISPLIYGNFSTFRIGFGETSPLSKLHIDTRLSTEIGLIVKASSSQTADLFQAKNSSGTTILEIQADGELGILQDSKKIYLGASRDFSLYYDGTDANIKSDEVSASDILIHTGSQKTIELQTVVYNDTNYNAINALPGASAPNLVNLASTGLKGYAFDGVNQTEELQFGAEEVLHGYKEGTDISFHVHWRPTTTGAGNVKWQFEIYWDNIDSTPGSTTNVSVVDAASGTAWQHLKTDELTISGTGKKIGSLVHVRVYRDPTDSADTYGSDAVLSSIGFHYQINTVGSRQLNVK